MPELLQDFIAGRVQFPNGTNNDAAQETLAQIHAQANEYFGTREGKYAFGRDGSVIIVSSDGKVETRSAGTRAWRNNNPGNIRNGSFARRKGSIGEAGGFAVFPSEKVGVDAVTALLNTSSYQPLSINDAINRYAPPIENNTKNYQSLIQRFTGLDGTTTMSTLNNSQLQGVVEAIGRVEGWREGEVKIK